MLAELAIDNELDFFDGDLISRSLESEQAFEEVLLELRGEDNAYKVKRLGNSLVIETWSAYGVYRALAVRFGLARVSCFGAVVCRHTFIVRDLPDYPGRAASMIRKQLSGLRY